MIDLMIKCDELITPTHLRSEKGRKTRVSYIGTDDGDFSACPRNVTLDIHTPALIQAMADATEARKPWLPVQPSDLPALNAKYDPSKSQEPVKKPTRFLNFGAG